MENFPIFKQIDTMVGLTLEFDTSLDKEIENIRNGHNNIDYWNNFKNDFYKPLNNEIKINNSFSLGKSPNFLKKFFMID